MNAAALVQSLVKQDVRLSVNGNRLDVDAPAGKLAPAMIETLKAHKTELLALLSEPPPLTDDDRANITEAIEERAAIQEFDGELTRTQAEAQAKAAMQVYRVRLAEEPTHWLPMIAPGCDLDEAKRSANNRWGPDRVLEVRRHQS